MRSKFNLSLLGILIVQVIVAIFVYGGNGAAEATSSGPWVQLNPDKLTALVITDGNGDSVTLKHAGNGWVVPAKSGFPADANRLQRLIKDLNSAHPDLPVAVSKAARARFHVAKDKFERHLVFKTAQGTAADLYLGESAGAGRVYARLADANAIDNLRLPLWRASARASDWLDKSYLEPDLGKLGKITLPKVTLVRNDGVWKPQGLADDRVPDRKKIGALVSYLNTLRWDKLAGTTAAIQLPSQPSFEMKLTPKKDKALVYRFYEKAAPGKENNEEKNANPVWRVTRSDADFVLTVGDQRVEPFLKADKASLSKAKPAKTGKPSGKAGTSAGSKASVPGGKAGESQHPAGMN